jgi:hypothetical protein
MKMGLIRQAFTFTKSRSGALLYEETNSHCGHHRLHKNGLVFGVKYFSMGFARLFSFESKAAVMRFC